MKSSIQIAAAGILALASVATAQEVPKCAIECFTQVITDHPPMDCKEANMYLCFCKLPSLQWYFVDCAKSDCDSDSSSKAAIEFGTGVCAELGFPIDTADLTSPPATKEATLSMPSSSKTASTAAETTSAEASATETSTDDDATAAVTSSTVSQASETSTAETSTAENTSAEESETDASSTDAVASASDAAASASASVVDSMANSASFSGLVAAAGVAVAVFGLF